ncbi:MAG: DUF4388 domain-containing protein [Thermodesulfobacteriota bacterium]
MNLQGDFEGSFLTTILQLLCDDHNTGVLQVTCSRKSCKVFFQEGTIVYAISTESRYRLGEMLLRDGIITAEQLEEALQRARRLNIAIGKVLLEQNAITLDVFSQYNTRQVEDILYSMLFWTKGRFDYQDATLRFDRMVVTQLNPMKLILEASRRIDEMSLLTEQIRGDNCIYEKVAGRQNEEAIAACSALEKCILELAGNGRSVRDIIAASHYDDFTVYKSLYSLLASGLIEKIETNPLAASGFTIDRILSIYTNILDRIAASIAAVSRVPASTLIRQAKGNLPPAQQRLLQDFHLSSAPQVNHQAIMAACDKAGSLRMQQSLLLIDAFNGLCHHLLLQTVPLAREEQIYDLIGTIDLILDTVQRHPGNSMEKNKILSDMRRVLNDTMKQIRALPEKPREGGFFSLFTKK